MSSVKSQQLVRLLAGLDAAEIKRGNRNKIVAEKTGYSLDSVKRILSGNSALTSRFIQAVCSVFKINSDWVLLANEPVMINEQTDRMIPTDDWSGQSPVVFEGERLRELREVLGYSYEEMAQQLNVRTQTLQQHEKEVFISDGFLLRKLALLGVNINWLMTGRGEMRLNVWPIIISKQNAKTDGWGRSISIEYKIDDLFTTRLKHTLGNRSPEWLSNETGIKSQKLLKIMDGQTIPSVEELETIASALGNINPTWLAETSPIPSENWKFEYCRHEEPCEYTNDIICMIKGAVDEYYKKNQAIKQLSPDQESHVINVLFRLHMNESNDSFKINEDIVNYIVGNSDSWEKLRKIK